VGSGLGRLRVQRRRVPPSHLTRQQVWHWLAFVFPCDARPICSVDALREVTEDALLHWAAQGLRAGVSAWAMGSAVVVAVKDLARRDRIAVAGAVEDVGPLVVAMLAEVGPSYRPIGEAALIEDLCGLVPHLVMTPPFGWMSTSAAPDPDPRPTLASPVEDASINELLDVAFPNSLARPSLPGVTRWWVLRDGSSIGACAADAWSAPGVGLLAGVASAPGVRGRGFGRAVVSAALAAIVDDYGSAALMVEVDNAEARGLYESFAMSYRLLCAAATG
jgi:GNAT superfamily N-acetyltransferase